ncbi:P-loop containing nucleoside triphosphate hydrolase protein [Gonapodya prolifera JEL478]|uniref:p-loop containing nucleoside triphosphate hydrolase protein n=1 Tax=Gonapodya prolifera (strain JEL478) TaxID=1344416 RepID=A0A139AZK9_GONPJ|nr:P-loop containing nucleoside triphosphate hydrolase protein [Gonapodya prolifera JEL478]|eukprot:KXS22159.1 P-loop containing nucleoside triphosphate hydrolase protein [Gonapodya prolifera JEL478]
MQNGGFTITSGSRLSIFLLIHYKRRLDMGLWSLYRGHGKRAAESHTILRNTAFHMSAPQTGARVFISGLDTPLGHNISRLLSRTVMGSRRPPSEDNADQDKDEAAEDEAEKPHVQKPTYRISGTLTVPRMTIAEALEYSAGNVPGGMSETGDRARDFKRREAIEKFALPGICQSWVENVVESSDREKLKEELMASDIIIYDTLRYMDEAVWAAETLSAAAETYPDKPKLFVALSTVLTWGRTKPEEDDPDGVLHDYEFRRRRAHPNFKANLAAEKSISKAGKKSSFHTYIVNVGLLWHSGESIFHYLLKNAWHNSESLTVYGDGSNIVPTIHIDDLTNIVVDVVDNPPGEQKYILAVDDSKSTMGDIAKAISSALTTGKVDFVPKEQALLQKYFTQYEYDTITMNLKMDPGKAKEMSFEWKYESGIVENMPLLVQEYKDARGLWPLKIVVHGPPASGKTTVAKALAEHYRIHYVSVEDVMKSVIEKLESRVAAVGTEGEPSDDDPEAAKELLDELQNAVKSNGVYPEEKVAGFVRERLNSMPCKNQGYVLDAYPLTMEDAGMVFKASEDDDSGDDKKMKYDEHLMPEFVIALEASDEVLKDRVMKLPETDDHKSKYAEENFLKSLENFSKINTPDNTVLNYFDENEVHPMALSAETTDVSKLQHDIMDKIGKPRNYGATREEISERNRIRDEEKAREAAIAAERQLLREKEEAERQAKALVDWNLRLEEVKKQEREVLEAQSVPLRNYLMKYVMPTVTQGLIEVVKVRPEDPIDYLAEYLFKHANASPPSST